MTEFMSEVLALISNMPVSFCNSNSGLTPQRVIKSESRKLTLDFGKAFFTLSKEARVGDLLPVRKVGKIFQPYIDSDYRPIMACYCLKLVLATKNHIPATSIPLDRHGFDLTINVAVLLEPDVTDALQVNEATGLKLAPVTVAGPGHAIVATFTLVAGKAALFASLDTLKESLKTFVQSAEYILSGTKVNGAKVGAELSNLFKLVGLVEVVDRLTYHAISLASLSESGIIEFAAKLKVPTEQGLLLPGRIKAVFESFARLRFTHRTIVPK